MMRQQEQIKTQESQEIAPKQVWPTMTDKEQEQFVQTIEAICQRLASRQMRQEEGHNGTSEPS
jgi:hypothetical protein